MTKIGLGLPGLSVQDVERSAEAASHYPFDSFSVYGDLGDLPPYSVLHASADLLAGSAINRVGPMGVPLSLQHPEVIGGHAIALEQQLPGKSYIGMVRGAFLEQIGERPATLAKTEEAISHIKARHAAQGLKIPLYLGGFGPKLLALAGRLDVEGVKLGGTTNVLLAQKAREKIDNPAVKIVMGAVSVVDKGRKAARRLARHEVAKYLNVVGDFDTSLNEDERASLHAFCARFPIDPDASNSISDSLLDKFALAGNPEDVIERISAMHGQVDRFEFGTPHGLSDRATAIKFIGDNVLNELGEQA